MNFCVAFACRKEEGTSQSEVVRAALRYESGKERHEWVSSELSLDCDGFLIARCMKSDATSQSNTNTTTLPEVRPS